MSKVCKLLVLLTAALMFLTLVSGVALAGAEESRVEFNIGETTFTENGKEDEMDVAPFIRNGRTFIPVRYIAEALGAEADWEPKGSQVETVYLECADLLITIGIGENMLSVLNKESGDKEPISMDTAAFIENGRTFLPFRFIAQAFGADVAYSTNDSGQVDRVWFTQEKPAKDPQPEPEGPVSPENSRATAEDQQNGSALVTLEVRDGFGNGISGFSMDDFEVSPQISPHWLSLTVTNESEFVTIAEFTDHGDGTYTYLVFRGDGLVILSFRVDDVVFHTGLEIFVTGNE